MPPRPSEMLLKVRDPASREIDPRCESAKHYRTQTPGRIEAGDKVNDSGRQHFSSLVMNSDIPAKRRTHFGASLEQGHCIASERAFTSRRVRSQLDCTVAGKLYE